MARIEDILREHREKHLEFVAALCVRVVEDMPKATARQQLAEAMKRCAGSMNPADALAAIVAAREPTGCVDCGRFCDGAERCDICL